MLPKKDLKMQSVWDPLVAHLWKVRPIHKTLSAAAQVRFQPVALCFMSSPLSVHLSVSLQLSDQMKAVKAQTNNLGNANSLTNLLL